MLQYCSSLSFGSPLVQANGFQENSENWPAYMSHYQPQQVMNASQNMTITNSPLQSSILCSNNNRPLYDELMVSPTNKYDNDPHRQYSRKNISDREQQTLSGDELQALTSIPISRMSSGISNIDEKNGNSNCNGDDDKDDTASLVHLSRRLRTNLSLAKQRMMIGLKQSNKPNDIAIYTQLENITLNDSSCSSVVPDTMVKHISSSSSSSSSITKSTRTYLPRSVTSTITPATTVGNGKNLFSNKHHLHHLNKKKSSIIPFSAPFLSTNDNNSNKFRVHKKKPYCRGSSYMELQTNPNGYVSVVLRKSSSSSKDSYATLTRSFSFNILDEDSEEDDSDDSDMETGDDSEMETRDDSTFGNDGMNATTTTSDLAGPGPWTPPFTTMTTTNDDDDDEMKLNLDMMEMMTPTWMNDMEYVWQQQQQQQKYDDDDQYDGNNVLHMADPTMNENEIDSWLQRGGFGCSPLVAATDQELADLLQFD
ncbi:uncharacterized protein BX664DRAFT_327379 [Halteromyces radiatus]|uniref:uncharacterized protein n=1 Tax=Halteromyces radiatus TaxID=101107 RepID=UPI0022204C98|nr:uncharacterized protein BX664DRAFT_327379 [Halteromyces radiatus]KAI8092481.1 hypothetical protein BX664DRAFT_327379 [Halteromyces radiatus]